MKKIYKIKLTVVFLLLTILVSFTHCISNAPIDSGLNLNANSGPTISPPITSNEQQITEAQVEVGIKNYEEIYHTFVAVTGVPEFDNLVKVDYNLVTASLPTTNDIKSFLPPNQVAILRLASMFCTRLIDNNGSRSQIWPDQEYNLPLNNFGDDKKLIVVQKMLDAFWGPHAGSEIDEVASELSGEETTYRQSSESQLVTLMNDLKDGLSLTNNAQNTRKLMKSACTAALSSAYVTMH